jgi:hypothetical protein
MESGYSTHDAYIDYTIYTKEDDGTRYPSKMYVHTYD